MKKIIILYSFLMFFLFVDSSHGIYLYEGEDTANLTLEVVEPITFISDSMILDFGVHTSSRNTEILESNELIINITGSYNDGNSLNIYFDNELLEKTISLTSGDKSITSTIRMEVINNLDKSNEAQIRLKGEIAIGEIEDKVSGDYSGVIKIYAEYN